MLKMANVAAECVTFPTSSAMCRIEKKKKKTYMHIYVLSRSDPTDGPSVSVSVWPDVL